MHQLEIPLARLCRPPIDAVARKPDEVDPRGSQQRQREHAIGPNTADGRRQGERQGENEGELEEAAPAGFMLLEATEEDAAGVAR